MLIERSKRRERKKEKSKYTHRMQINNFNRVELLKPFALTRRSLMFGVDTRSRNLRGNSFITKLSRQRRFWSTKCPGQRKNIREKGQRLNQSCRNPQINSSMVGRLHCGDPLP